MAYIISKPTRRELQERLRETAARNPQPTVRGVMRRTEEAFEVSERLRRETGEEPILAVDGDAPESVQARIEIAQRIGSTDPERDQEFM